MGLPVCTPDCDNVLKIILDALNGVVYEDDKQICNVIFSKTYSLVPKISVKIRRIENWIILTEKPDAIINNC